MFNFVNVSKVEFYPYRTAKINSIIKIMYNADIALVLGKMLKMSNGKMDNHICFCVTMKNGDKLWVGLSDYNVSIGTSANIGRW